MCIFQSEQVIKLRNFLVSLETTNGHRIRQISNNWIKFAGYVALIFTCKRCKFGGKLCYNSRDIEFFLGIIIFGAPCISRFCLLRHSTALMDFRPQNPRAHLVLQTMTTPLLCLQPRRNFYFYNNFGK